MENNNKMPKGISYIIGNEFAERFSYYGMKAILTDFMTIHLLNEAGKPAPMSEEESKVWFHLFGMANYLFPVFGALLSDVLWGKYKTIIALSVIYCLGHVALSIDETRIGLSLGLTMIAIGSGGIKPCVSAHVGDQFEKSNQHLLDKVFNLFYLALNVGAAISMILTPLLLTNFGPHVAFGFPGILMIIATIIFWFGRNTYRSIPPIGIKKYWVELKKHDNLQIIGKLSIIYVFFAIFWSLYEQTGSSWVIQGRSEFVLKNFNLNFFGSNYNFLIFSIQSSQLQSLNPILVILFIPLFSYFVYPAIGKLVDLTPIKKISIGFFLIVLSFLVIAWIEVQIQNRSNVSILWQALAYILLTGSEVMVYGTGLAFSYSQAPKSMKSLIMGMYLLSISVGNLITAIINFVIQNPDGTSKLVGADYYWFFVGMMFITAIGFIFIARNYKMRIYLHE